MNLSRSLSGLFCAVSLSLAGCGGSNPAPISTLPQGPAVSPLAGNWLITGAVPGPLALPVVFSLAATIDVNGNQISARESFAVPCSNGGAIGGGGGSASGALAADNSFTIQSDAPPTGVTIPTPDSFQIVGVAPATAGASWSGKYTYTPGSSTCSQPLAGSFTATPIQNLEGKYSGSANLRSAQSSGGSSTPITLQLTLQQGATVTPAVGAAYFQSSAVTGTIAVSGISCFAHGTSASVKSAPSSAMSGSFFTLAFTMDDGSSLLLSGNLLSADSSRLSARLLSIRGGGCDGEIEASSFELDR